MSMNIWSTVASFEPEQDIIDSVYSNRSGETVKCEKKLKDRGKTRIIIMVNSYSFCLHLFTVVSLIKLWIQLTKLPKAVPESFHFLTLKPYSI